MSYPVHSLIGVSYPSAEVQSLYSLFYILTRLDALGSVEYPFSEIFLGEYWTTLVTPLSVL